MCLFPEYSLNCVLMIYTFLTIISYNELVEQIDLKKNSLPLTPSVPVGDADLLHVCD